MATRRSLDQQHSIVAAGHDYGIILDSREIFIYGETDMEGEMGTTFVTSMRILLGRSTTEPIIIHQHNLGGDWCCGMMIYDMMVTCPCPIIFMCHGLAASMGSIIPMACVAHDDCCIVNMPNCSWLIHDGTTDIHPGLTIKQAKSWAGWEDKTRVVMMDWYVTACKRSSLHKNKSDKAIRNFIEKKMNENEDWWLTAREAVDQGFANAVLGDEGYETINKIKAQFV